jgi:transketolase
MLEFEVQNKKDTRSGFGDALTELGKENPNVVALCADLTGSLKMDAFAKEFPERFFQTGIAEANMIGMAAGLATAGKIPFTGTFANFSTSRVLDQLRQSVSYSNKNVKVCASHAGLTLGEDGATHQTMEDIGVTKALPHFTVINPCDYNQTKAATKAIANFVGPVYLRFGRPKVENFTDVNQKFEIGKAWKIHDGSDVTIIATGHMVWKAIQAAKELEKNNISVDLINIHTIKPLDQKSILESVKKTKCVVVAEEHLMNNGLGDSISQLTSRNFPVAIEYIAVDDQFGESGTPEELLDKYGLNVENIIKAAEKVIKRKL